MSTFGAFAGGDTAVREAATDAAHDLIGESVDEATDEVEQPEASAVDTAEVQHDADTPTIPQDVLELIETPDFEAEAEAEVEAEQQEDEWEDDATKELKKKLRAAEKRAEFLEQQRLRNELPRWKEEARKYFPHADVDSIDAQSRRAFLRTAKQQHEAVADKVEAAVAAKLAGFDPEAEREKIRAEVKAELQQAWGDPTVSTTIVPGDAAEQDAKVDAAIQNRGLAAGILEMFKQ